MNVSKVSSTLTVVIFSLLVATGCADEDGFGADTSAEMAAPSQIVFSQTPVGQRQTKRVQLKNVGNGILEIRKLSLREKDGDDRQELSIDNSDTGPTRLENGETKTVKIHFDPETTEAIQGTLRIKSNSLTGNQNGVTKIDIITPNLGPKIAARSSVTFAQVAPGQTEVKTLWINNAGTAPLTFNNVSLRSSDSDFSISFPDIETRSNVPATSLPAREKIKMKIEFSPADSSAAKNTIIFETNDPTTPSYEVQLKGNGQVSCLETSLKDPTTFSDTNIGITDQKVRTITNCSETSKLRIKDMTLTDDASGHFGLQELPDTFPWVIEAGETARFTMTFEPSETKAYEGSLKVVTNDPVKGTMQMALEGKGVEPNDNVHDCGGGNVVRVDNVDDMRRHQVESDCDIRVFPEKKNVSHGPLTVEITQLEEGTKGSGSTTVDTDEQPVNSYGVHYDMVGETSGRENGETSEGTITFENEIIGLIASSQALYKTNKQLGICKHFDTAPGMDRQHCGSANTIYPTFGQHNYSYYAIEKGDRKRSAIVGPKTMKLDFFTNSNADNGRIITKAD